LTDLTDAQWAVPAPLLPVPACQRPSGGRPEQHESNGDVSAEAGTSRDVRVQVLAAYLNPADQVAEIRTALARLAAPDAKTDEPTGTGLTPRDFQAALAKPGR
jgi:hypothetical protein